jgi:pimeloyl-ACP methyl ester carboxylesterase
MQAQSMRSNAARSASVAARRPSLLHRLRWRLGRILGALAVAVIALASTGFVVQTVATVADQRNLPAPGQLVYSGGKRLHIQCSGQGSPTVVLETGLGAWSSHWALIQPAIAEHTRVCSYDRAGLGWSEPVPAPRDANRIAIELHALLQAAGIPAPYVLAGHSNGGLYARLFTSLYPSEVIGLVLADPTPVDLFARLPATRGDFSSLEQQARAFAWLAPFGALRLIIPAAIGAELSAFPARTREEITALDSTGAQWSAFAAEMDALGDSMTQVARTGDLGTRPLVVLSSTRGAAKSVAEAEIKLQLDAEIAALSLNSRHVVVEGATHAGLASNPEHAQITAAAIVRVLDAARAGQSVAAD